MKSGRALVACVVAAAACTLTGCTAPAVCAGAAIPVPAVYLDASPWLAAHPSGEVDACYGERCETISADDPRPAQLIHLGADAGAPLELKVTADAGADHVAAAQKVALKSLTDSGPCGAGKIWGRDVVFTAAGRLEVHGWNGSSPAQATPVPSDATAQHRAAAAAQFEQSMQRLEAQDGVRIGVDAQLTGTQISVSYRGDERFAFDSTGKIFAAGLLLRQDTDAQLDAVVRYSSADLVANSPITSQHVADGMSLRDLIAAALQHSDNTAENLMLEQLGGPAGVEQQLRGIGDSVTHVDRTEPALNSAVPDDPQDTTSPPQMADDLRRFLVGDLLSPVNASWLVTTMKGSATGAAGIRSSVSPPWVVADKTGSGGYGSSNDVAVIFGPSLGPIVLVIFTTGTTPDAESAASLIPAITKAAITALG